MPSKPSKNEWLQGLEESAAGIKVLRSFWPNAFPQQGHLVRPLVVGLAGQIAERTGWTPRYTAGVLRGWKLRRAYCDAVLQYSHRFNLDGEEVADAIVEEEAREQARGQLAKLAARWERGGKKPKHRPSGKAAEDKTQAGQASAPKTDGDKAKAQAKQESSSKTDMGKAPVKPASPPETGAGKVQLKRASPPGIGTGKAQVRQAGLLKTVGNKTHAKQADSPKTGAASGTIPFREREKH